MKRRMAAILLLTAGAVARGADPVALEPRCLVIEPSVLRTELAKSLPGARLTVLVPAREEDIGAVHLSADEFRATGLTWDKFRREAEAAAARHLARIEPVMEKGADGAVSHAVLKSKSHLTASVMLCPEFYARFRPVFGDRLVVLVPDRFTVYVFPRSFSGFQEFGKRVVEEHRRAVYPSSIEAFEVNSEGVRGIGAFDTGDDEGQSEPGSEPPPNPAGKESGSPEPSRVPRRGK